MNVRQRFIRIHTKRQMAEMCGGKKEYEYDFESINIIQKYRNNGSWLGGWQKTLDSCVYGSFSMAPRNIDKCTPL